MRSGFPRPRGVARVLHGSPGHCAVGWKKTTLHSLEFHPRSSPFPVDDVGLLRATDRRKDMRVTDHKNKAQRTAKLRSADPANECGLQAAKIGNGSMLGREGVSAIPNNPATTRFEDAWRNSLDTL